MARFRFDHWYASSYHDPSVGLVQPGDIIEADENPDPHNFVEVFDAAPAARKQDKEAVVALTPDTTADTADDSNKDKD